MNPKETEIIDLLMKAANKALWHTHETIKEQIDCPVCNDVASMIQMAKRLMADD